jgi:hypothetical protein
MLTQQFGQIAAATSASMSPSQGIDPASRTTSDASVSKKTQAPIKKPRARAAAKKST